MLKFKRGFNPKKSLNIGAFRTLKDPTELDLKYLPDGEYLIITRSKRASETIFLIIERKGLVWKYSTAWESNFHAAEFAFLNKNALVSEKFFGFFLNVGKWADEIRKY